MTEPILLPDLLIFLGIVVTFLAYLFWPCARRHRWMFDNVNAVIDRKGGWLRFLAVVVLVAIIAGVCWSHTWDSFLGGNLMAEIAGIAVTVGIIDWLTERRIDRQEQMVLRTYLGSKNQVFVEEALTRLQGRRWMRSKAFQNLYIQKANFKGLDLSGADLTGAYLPEANFEGAKLWAVVFADAVLAGASFRGADVQWAKFVRVNLSGADMRVRSLYAATVSEVIYDDDTIWPDDYSPPPRM